MTTTHPLRPNMATLKICSSNGLEVTAMSVVELPMKKEIVSLKRAFWGFSHLDENVGTHPKLFLGVILLENS